MSNNSHLLHLPNDSFSLHPGPNVLQGSVGDAGNASGQSQEQSRQLRMSPSPQDAFHGQRYGPPSLGDIPWASNELNQWPIRLFTTAPPTPTGGSTLPLAFMVPSGQQELEEVQSPSQPPPASPEPVLPFVNQLLPINYTIFKNCRGNCEHLWPAIAEEIHNLQQGYGELIVPVSDLEQGPRYKCGICEHPATKTKIHKTTKRKWDWSPDILGHGPNKYKPWFCKCGEGFPRDRERRRHAEKCQDCKDDQRQLLLMSMPNPQGSSQSSYSLRPIPPFPTENTVPQETVIPSSPNANRNHDGFQGLPSPGTLHPVPSYHPQAPSSVVPPQQSSYHQDNRHHQRSSYPSDHVSRTTRGHHAVHPYPYHPSGMDAVPTNHGGNSYHLEGEIAALTLQPGSGGAQFMPQHAPSQHAGLGSNPQFGNTRRVVPYQGSSDYNGGSGEKGSKVPSAMLLGVQPEKCDLEGLSKHEGFTRAHRFTVSIFLSLAAIVWLILRIFVLP